MTSSSRAVRLPPRMLVAALVTGAWILSLFVLDARGAQTVSNIGLVTSALGSSAAALLRARAHAGAMRRVWLMLGAATGSWGAGLVVSTWYETVLQEEVPSPSLADIGYLGLPLLAATGLLMLPLGSQTRTSRVRTLLDGLLVAGSLLLCSWVVVLHSVVAGADGLLVTAVSVAYPLGDVVLITIVVYAALRLRHSGRVLPLSLPLVGSSLVALSVGDSGYLYLTSVGLYRSGNPIDIGWFVGFVLMWLAARQPAPDRVTVAGGTTGHHALTNVLPYAAVLLAVGTSVLDVLSHQRVGDFVFWVRTALMALLVFRQVLSLAENHQLTAGLERRVQERTAALRTSEQRFSALVQHSSDLVTVLDPDGTVRYQSGSGELLFGYPADQTVGRPIYDLLDPGPAADLMAALNQATTEANREQTLQSTWRHATGRACEVEITITNLLADPAVGGLVLNTRDVTDRVVLERQLTTQAFTDSLTGLPNRALFRDRLRHALARRGTATDLVVYFLDLDGFKAVNDTRGHSAGDDLLVQVAARLRSVLRPSDTIARFGGDEFAVLVDDLAAADDGTDLAGRLCDSLQDVFLVADEPVHIRVSVGLARMDPDSADAEQLLRNADLAMYQAKAARAGGYAVYDPTLHTGLVERVRLEADLRTALERDEFLLHYQPMVSMVTGRVTGMEALVRWQHPGRGLVSPDTFIPVAESTGLILDLGLWVLETACRQVAAWNRDLGTDPPLRLSVNVAARQLQQPQLAAQVTGVLAATGFPAGLLTLELTESVLIDNHDHTVRTLEDLRAQGIKLAIDDFGTGYSSLSYLHRFPVDTLKIDRSFVERIAGGDLSLVQTILQLGASMQLETVAEGIEGPEQAQVLRDSGCVTGQGFHISRPLPAVEFERLLRSRAGRADEGVADLVGAP